MNAASSGPPAARPCDACGEPLRLLSELPGADEYQFDNALWLGFHGGYGMFIDPVGHADTTLAGVDREAVLCHDCAHRLCAENPWLDRLLQPTWSHAHPPGHRPAGHPGWDMPPVVPGPMDDACDACGSPACRSLLNLDGTASAACPDCWTTPQAGGECGQCGSYAARLYTTDGTRPATLGPLSLCVFCAAAGHADAPAGDPEWPPPPGIPPEQRAFHAAVRAHRIRQAVLADGGTGDEAAVAVYLATGITGPVTPAGAHATPGG